MTSLRTRLCIGLVATSSALCLATPAAEAATATGLGTMTYTNDQFVNYDFSSQSQSATNVDWAMSLMFWNNADINGVKGVFGNRYPSYGGPKYAELHDTPAGWAWDSDRGAKTDVCSTAGRYTRHYRIYADSDDRVGYTPGLGYWNIASTHRDVQECTSSDYYDNSEGTENDMASYAISQGGTVNQDYADWHNRQYNANGNHYWENDGKATYIKIY